MKLKRSFTLLISTICMLTAMSQEFHGSMNKVKLSFTIDESGKPIYSVSFDNKIVIKPSSLGFRLTDAAPMIDGFELTNMDSLSVDQTWKPVWGEVSQVRDRYTQLNFHLIQKKSKRLLDLKFRIFEDGVGFRYEFPKQTALNYFIIADELTQFNLAGDHKTFWIPGDYDTNEYPYTTSKISQIDNTEIVKTSTDICVRTVTDPTSVQTPLMMKTNDGLYINIHEAALVDYPAMQLHVNKRNFQMSSSLVPDAMGNKAYVHAPFHTPWRTIIVSDKARHTCLKDHIEFE